MAWPTSDSFGTVLSLGGAFVIGGVFHHLLQGGLSPTSPVTLVGGLVGGLLLVVGYRWQRRFDPAQFTAGSDDDDGEEFDASLSPITDPVPEDHGKHDTENP